MNFAAVYSSDLRRAAETAQAIADRCQCSKVSSYLHWNAVILIQALGIGLKGLGGK
jgi:broad specificity phosphatase PhoE